MRYALCAVSCHKVFGGYTGGVTPVPIPNTEVKPSRADDTMTERSWESRTPPEYIIRAHHPSDDGFFYWCARQAALTGRFTRPSAVAFDFRVFGKGGSGRPVGLSMYHMAERRRCAAERTGSRHMAHQDGLMR